MKGLLLLGINKINKSLEIKNLIIVTLSSYLNKFLGLLSIYILSSKLSTTEYGTLTIQLTIIYAISELAQIGSTSATTRFISIFFSEKKLEKIGKLLCSQLVTLIVISAIVVVGKFYFLDVIFLNEKASYHRDIMIAVVFGVIFQIIFSLFDSTLKGLENFKTYFVFNFLSSILRIISILLLFKFNSATIPLLIYSHSIPLIFSIAFAMTYIFKVGISYKFFLFDISVLKETFSFSKWMILFSLVFIIQTRVDIFILSKYSTIEEVAYFDIANKLIGIFTLAIGSYSIVFNPRFSRIKNNESFKIEMRRNLKFIILLILVVLISIPIVPIILDFIFNNKYNNSIVPLQIMQGSLVFYCITAYFNTGLFGLGKSNAFFLNILVQTIINIVLSYILVPRYGAIGSAISMIFFNLSSTIITYFLYKKNLKKAELESDEYS